MMSTADSTAATSLDRKTKLGLSLLGLLLAANAIVPLVCGDLYPFTSAPMFRDRPGKYCNYRVVAPDGTALPPQSFGAQRLYDGNPVGYGVGLAPPPILENFGAERTEAEVRAHLQALLARPENKHLPYVVVEQEVRGPTPAGRIETLRVDRWRIERSSSPAAE